ncbi:uncharacterized protein Pyn_12782 [Prunus yedoensis var. nudiflora]|uniref:Uncharacterized protein n=1 Tax=Prunus yedoensis var. nudiflora TaxID=2094558 RepID=A0A314XZG7_PRUYE|nr:uncharacterized protein Pyn_12782 [Prunus yedoensis var. nudiflora]
MHAFQGNYSITQAWKNQRNSETKFCSCTERDIEERRGFVLSFTVERDPNVNNISTDAYTVHVESHRILTVTTFSEATVTKWLKQVLKFTKSTILVGVAAEVDNTRRWLRKKDPPYDMLCLTIGCHCFIYEYFDDKPAGLLVSFLANPRVFAVAATWLISAGSSRRTTTSRFGTPSTSTIWRSGGWGGTTWISAATAKTGLRRPCWERKWTWLGQRRSSFGTGSMSLFGA